MKRLLIIPCLVLHVCAAAQSVINVKAFEEDGTVMIVYDLYTTKVDKEFYVTVKSSKDKGKVFIPLFDAVGDVNKNVKVGPEHTIVWKPEQVPGDSLIFKVEAGPKRSSEEMSNPNESKIFHHASGDITVAKVVRINSDVEFSFNLKNNRAKDKTFIVANFYFVDEAGNQYKKAAVLQNAKEGAAVTCDPATTNQFKIKISGVPEKVSRFNVIAFALSEIPVSLSDLKIEQ